MTEIRNITALTGSTRGTKTASESMINYLSKRIEEEGITLTKYRVYQVYNDDNKKKAFFKDIKTSDLLIICSPVYVHSLPYPLISLMEELSIKTDKDFWQNKKMMVIIHSGYPKDIQRKASFAICKNFAEAMGIKWLGGVGFGGSPIIDGRPLEEVGGFTKWMRKAFDNMVVSIKTGSEISEEARMYAGKHFPAIPLWFLKTFMNMRVKSMVKKSGVNLYEQPYLSLKKEEF